MGKTSRSGRKRDMVIVVADLLVPYDGDPAVMQNNVSRFSFHWSARSYVSCLFSAQGDGVDYDRN